MKCGEGLGYAWVGTGAPDECSVGGSSALVVWYIMAARITAGRRVGADAVSVSPVTLNILSSVVTCKVFHRVGMV